MSANAWLIVRRAASPSPPIGLMPTSQHLHDGAEMRRIVPPSTYRSRMYGLADLPHACSAHTTAIRRKIQHIGIPRHIEKRTYTLELGLRLIDQSLVLNFDDPLRQQRLPVLE